MTQDTPTLASGENVIELATVVPDWLRSVAPAEWYERYGVRAEQTRFPASTKARQEFTETVGRDGFQLLELVQEQQPALSANERVKTLRQVWERHFARSETGEVVWRAESTLSRAAKALESPYDTEARHSNKHALSWTGYKVHLSETCDDELPHLVTNVHTTVATTQDVSCTKDIHQSLSERDLLPGRHLVDAGYIDAELLVVSQEKHSVELFGPPRGVKGWQVKEGGYDASRFQVDWENERAICPAGKVSSTWRFYENPPGREPFIKVRFAQYDCAVCPNRSLCVRSPGRTGRSLRVQPRAQYEALHQARTYLNSEKGAEEYKRRAGVEGTLSQGVRRSDLRHCRYRGLVKTHLQQLAIAAALNVVRIVDYLAGKPVAPTRTSRFARLAS